MRNQRQHYADMLEREHLTPPDEPTMEYLRLIVDEGALGASKHVQLIHDLFLHLIETSELNEAWRRVELVGAFIARTRGADTPVIANSIHWLLRGLDGRNPEQMEATLRERVKTWTKEAHTRLQRLTDVGVALLGDAPTLLTFDYSSTVAAVVEAVHTEHPGTKVIIPESRAIDGGAPYLREFAERGISVHYVLDMALEYVMPKASAVLLGVESLRCDGSFLNTIGSRLVARTARRQSVPVYGCTDLYKLDLRSYHGYLKNPSIKTFDERLLMGRTFPKEALIETASPELEVIPPELHDGFITDLGFLPPASVWTTGREIFPEVKEHD